MSHTIPAPSTTHDLQAPQGLVRGESAAPPIAQLIGFTLVQVELGGSVAELEAGPQHANPMGTLHGGIICDVADLAMGTAMATTLEDEESFTTLDSSVKFLKPVWNGSLCATATVLKRGAVLGLIECEVRDNEERPAAKMYSTCMVRGGEAARGR